MPKYFDIHSHLNFKDYDSDREEVIKRLRESDTDTIVIGTDLLSSQQAVELANKYEGLYAAIGIHPIDDKRGVFDEEQFEELVKQAKVVSIGECGLDFYHAKKEEDYERQKALFLKQVNFALKHNKPLMIHAREAYEELLALLEPLHQEYGSRLRGNIHFFAGNWAIAERLFNIGFTISFTGVLTYSSDYDEVVKRAPLENIMSETDAPFATPEPYRGQRNEPVYVNEVVKKIAELRGEELEAVRTQLVENALRMVR